jgi:hypothetical protein
MATVKMQKGDLLADIFDSPESIAQARREGYALIEVADIEKHGDDLEQLTKNELLELARQKEGFEKQLSTKNKGEIIAWIRASDPPAANGPDNKEDTPPTETEPPTRAELIQSAVSLGFEEASLDSFSDEEIAALLGQRE